MNRKPARKNLDPNPVMIRWGSSGPQGTGEFTVSIYSDGQVEVQAADWHDTNHYVWNYRHARQVARAILRAPGPERMKAIRKR